MKAPEVSMSMPPRKIRDAADADAQLAAARAAGLPNQTWAARNGICARSLHMWSIHRRRARRHAAPATQRFVELIPASSVVLPAQPLRIRLGDVEIDVPAGFDADTLTRLLGAVRAC